MTIKHTRKKNSQNVIVKKGKIGPTETYKYLGGKYDSTGSNMCKIQKKMEKIKFMAFEVKRNGSSNIVGKADTSLRLLLLKTIIEPSVLYNTETWVNITDEELKEIEKAHYEILQIVFEQSSGTPYFGILAETGLWPYSKVIIFKKLHNLMMSDDERICKR